MYSLERRLLERKIGKVSDEVFDLAVEMTVDDLSVNTKNEFMNVLATSVNIIESQKIFQGA